MGALVRDAGCDDRHGPHLRVLPAPLVYRAVPALGGLVLVANAFQDLVGPAAPTSLVATAGLLALLLLAAPLLIISLNGLRVRTCDWLFGFECYGALTIVSALWAAGLGVLCGLVAGPRRFLSNALPYLVLVALILHSLWRFYAAPPVFSYNPLVGYFPGNLYDEEIRARNSRNNEPLCNTNDERCAKATVAELDRLRAYNSFWTPNDNVYAVLPACGSVYSIMSNKSPRNSNGPVSRL